MIKLSKRLKEIVNLIDKNSKVADIGTDHGLVPNFLVENNISSYIVASDISEKSLEKTYELVDNKYIDSKIYLRVGNGLEVIEKNEVDTVILAGMGGILISKLIEKDFDKVENLKKLILQPMQNQYELREYLYKNGFIFNDQRIVYEEKKYFEIMDVSYKGEISKVDPIFYELPYECYKRKDETFAEYLLYKIRKNKFILNKLAPEEKTKRIENKILELNDKNERYEKLLWDIKSAK